MKKNLLKTLSVAFATVAVGGCMFGGCKSVPEDQITVYMPDGAPALALAGMMAADTKDDGVTYRVVAANVIATKVTNEDPDKNADLCVMPVTAATKLLGTGEEYKMLGTVTHGNLYILAEEGAAEINEDNLSALIGKTVGVLQINEVPGLTLKAILDFYDVPWRELKNGRSESDEEVNLVALTGADAVGVTKADYYVIAEPAASAQAKKGYSIVGDLQALYGGENGYAQAVLVAKNEIVEEKADWLKEFVEQVAESSDWLRTASGEEIVSCVSKNLEDSGMATSLKAPLLTSDVIARCGVRFTYAMDDFVDVEEFLYKLLDINSVAAAIPDMEFYWDYTK